MLSRLAPTGERHITLWGSVPSAFGAVDSGATLPHALDDLVGYVVTVVLPF